MSSNMGIYEIRNFHNNKVYIGSSKDIGKRWNEHIGMLKSNKHHSRHLQYAWDKYGEELFKFSILKTTKNQNELFDLEQYFMDRYKSYNPEYGYNISKTAKGCYIDKKYNIDVEIKKDSKKYDKFKLVKNVINKKIPNGLNLNNDMEFKYKDNINELVYNIYLYYVLIDFNTFYDVFLYIESGIVLRFQSLYEFQSDLVERIIFNNKITSIKIYDQRYGESAVVTCENLISWNVFVDKDHIAKIKLKDKQKDYTFSVYNNTD